METKTEERAHHPYSPSQLQSLEACPCYVGSSSENERAIAGTIAHKATETGEDDARLDDLDAAAVADCLDFIEGRRKIFEDNRLRALAIEKARLISAELPPVEELKEIYLPVDDLTLCDGTQHTTAGYIDHGLVSWDRKYAEIYDWKFGRWPVEGAKNNLQGLAYALGMFKRIPTLKRVCFYFKQPHLDAITSHTVTRADVEGVYLRIRTVVCRACAARKSQSFETAQPHVPVCNFCSRLGSCPKVAEFACQLGKKFYPLEIPDEITPTAVLTDRDVQVGLRLSQVVAVWAKAFRSQITDRVVRGAAAIPEGYLLQSKSTRKILDLEKFRKVAMKFITKKQYEKCCEPTFGAIEEIISEEAARGNKSAEVKRFGELLENEKAVGRDDPYTFLKAVPKKDKTISSDTTVS